MKSVVQASAKVQAGSMYGTMSAVANQRRPNISVRLINHASTVPISSDRLMAPRATDRVFRRGRQKRSTETGERNARSR
ncbi:hypothetical protein D9M69_456060 [compost metagenome]